MTEQEISLLIRSKDESKAAEECERRGYDRLKREDRFGDTRSGYWCDDTFIGRTAIDALRNAVFGC